MASQLQVSDSAEDPKTGGPSKTSRAITACTACRLRKIKCSGVRPICQACAKSALECTYPAGSKRRRENRLEEEDRSPRRHLPTSTKYARSMPSNSSATTDPPDQAIAGLFADMTSGLVSNDIGIDKPTINLDLNDILGFDTNAMVGLDDQTQFNGFNGDGSTEMQNSIPFSDDSRKKTRLRVPFFRFFGPTAIAPGYKQVLCEVSAPPSPSRRAYCDLMPLTAPKTLRGTVSENNETMFDVRSEMPTAEARSHLIPIFRLHFGYFFPSLHLDDRLSDNNSLSAPPYLVNIACALAARFSPVYSTGSDTLLKTGISSSEGDFGPHPNPRPCDIWATKAKEQVFKNIAIASVDMVHALILISWHEFAEDRDSGLWMYSGMALRMGQDLGLDIMPSNSASDTHQASPDLRCCLRLMDAVMTIGTGRSGMYPSSASNIPNFPPLYFGPSRIAYAHPYPYLVTIFALANEMTSIFVNRAAHSVDLSLALENTQTQLNEYHNRLPPELRFETATFQAYASMGQGGAFVLLHFWFHALIILAHQPSLLQNASNAEHLTPDVAGREIAASSAKTILDIAIFAELIDHKSITQPWVNYPLYIAARTFSYTAVAQHDSVINNNASADQAISAGKIHLAKTARANFHRVTGVLEMLKSHWHGVRYICSTLSQKAEGSAQINLVPDHRSSPAQLPPELSAMWQNASGEIRDDVVGVGLTGTMTSPYDNQCSLVYPSLLTGDTPQMLDDGDLARSQDLMKLFGDFMTNSQS